MVSARILDNTMTIEEQMKSIILSLVRCLPIRAFIYGQDVTKELTWSYNRRMLTTTSVKKEQSKFMNNFSHAIGNLGEPEKIEITEQPLDEKTPMKSSMR